MSEEIKEPQVEEQKGVIVPEIPADDKKTSKADRLNKSPRCKFCKRPAIKDGNGNCHFHNGRAAKGPACANYKHGKFSKYKHILPDAMQLVYEAAVTDPDKLSMVPEIALFDVQLDEAVRQLSDSTTLVELWEDQQDDLSTLEGLMKESGTKERKKVVIARIIARGKEGYRLAGKLSDTKDRILTLGERRSKLAKMEADRLSDETNSLRADKVVGYANAMTNMTFECLRHMATVFAEALKKCSITALDNSGPVDVDYIVKRARQDAIGQLTHKMTELVPTRPEEVALEATG